LAFQTGNTSFVSLVGLINVLYAFLVDISVFHLSFNYLQIIGALMITFFNVAVIYSQLSQESRQLIEEKSIEIEQITNNTTVDSENNQEYAQ
jgi:ABC-type nickel/cobalt efflux system permease component RcnA